MSRREVYRLYQQHFRAPQENDPTPPDVSTEWKGNYPDVVPGRAKSRQYHTGYSGAPTGENPTESVLSIEWIGNYPNIVRREPHRQNLGGLFRAPEETAAAPADTSTEWIGTYPVYIRREKHRQNLGGMFKAPQETAGPADVSTEWMGSYPAIIPGRAIHRQYHGWAAWIPSDESAPTPSGLKRRRIFGAGFDL